MEKVYVFLDHSNIDISSKNVSAKNKGFPSGIFDSCIRVTPGKVYDFLQAHYTKNQAVIEKFYCYTAESDVCSHANINNRPIIPRIMKKSNKNKEKSVDSYMVADAIETFYEQILIDSDALSSLNVGNNQTSKRGIICLCTGDMDILQPVIEKAERKQVKVEVWSFQASTSDFMNKFSTVPVNSFDKDKEYESLIETYYGAGGNLDDPKSCIRLQFEMGSPDLEWAKANGQNNWKKIVKNLTLESKLPLQASYKWEVGALYLVLPVPPNRMAECVGIIAEKKQQLQDEVQGFMKYKYQVRSTCELIIPQVLLNGPPRMDPHQQGLRGTGNFRRPYRGRGGPPPPHMDMERGQS